VLVPCHCVISDDACFLRSEPSANTPSSTVALKRQSSILAASYLPFPQQRATGPSRQSTLSCWTEEEGNRINSAYSLRQGEPPTAESAANDARGLMSVATVSLFSFFSQP
jgi:hypothetical protein